MDVSPHKPLHQQIADQARITVGQYLGIAQDEVALQARIPS